MTTIGERRRELDEVARAKMSFFNRVLVPLFFLVMTMLTLMAGYVGYKLDGFFLSFAVSVGWFGFFFIGLMWSVSRTSDKL